jgi:hypothetical protein
MVCYPKEIDRDGTRSSGCGGAVPAVHGAPQYGPPARTSGTGTGASRLTTCWCTVRTRTVWGLWTEAMHSVPSLSAVTYQSAGCFVCYRLGNYRGCRTGAPFQIRTKWIGALFTYVRHSVLPRHSYDLASYMRQPDIGNVRKPGFLRAPPWPPAMRHLLVRSERDPGPASPRPTSMEAQYGSPGLTRCSPQHPRCETLTVPAVQVQP